MTDLAPQEGMAFAGWTGLLRVPTAEVRRDLALGLAFIEGEDPPLRFASGQRTNRHLVLTVPVWSWLEVGLGMLQVPGWIDPLVPALPEGAVHRTSHLKLLCPFPVADWHLAAGVFDPLSANALVGLQGTRYGMGTVYAVGTRAFGDTKLTLGWAAGDVWRPGGSPGPWWPGPMAGLEQRMAWPVAWGPLSLMVDWDGRRPWGGFRWSPTTHMTIQAGGGEGAVGATVVTRTPL